MCTMKYGLNLGVLMANLVWSTPTSDGIRQNGVKNRLSIPPSNMNVYVACRVSFGKEQRFKDLGVRGRCRICQHRGCSGVGAIAASFVPTE